VVTRMCIPINMLMTLRDPHRLHWKSVQPTKKLSKQPDCYQTIHSNEQNMHWGFNVLYCLCAQRYQYVTQ